MESPSLVDKYRGLAKDDVSGRILRYGYNELAGSKPKTVIDIAVGVLREPMFILLVVCASLYMVLGEIPDGLMLLVFVLVIMAIEFFQERKSEKALDALKDLASPRGLVIRAGVEVRVPGREIVPDDIIVLQEGDRVPADAVVLDCVNLLIDESLLTGESVPVRKHQWRGEADELNPGGEDMPFVYSGSMVVQGNGIARVTHTGQSTQIGRIGVALGEVKETPTRLKIEINRLVKRLTVIGALLCVLVIAVYIITRGEIINGFLAGITLAMAMLPEEFPVVFTIFMAIGAWRVSKKRVLTRKSSAIESLGAASVLCTDKTGTLTENCMQVAQLYNRDGVWRANDENEFPEEFHDIIEYGILSSQTNPFDPMEKAINRIGDLFLQNTEHIHRNWEMIREYPLSREMLAMSRVFRRFDSDCNVIAAKGAPEAIFDLCHLAPEELSRYAEAVQRMASAGLRVLGVAKSDICNCKLPDLQHDFNFEFVGLIGLSDPIRAEVPAAVAECLRAGIRVIMITGDYPVTAQNIAKEIGLVNYRNCITGRELADMSDGELREKIKITDVFARVVPEQKLKIVNALKRNGEVVAMTGDGVNDAPALKAADIGIAMGAKGTDVAREASDLVLLDDNFGSIVEAVKMGRRIFDNLQKALGYIFAIHVPIAGLSLIPVFLADMPLILWPVHVVFMELIIDPACSVIFEAEIAERGIMSRPARKISQTFFGARKILIGCFQGVCILIMTLGLYFIAIDMGYPDGIVRAMTFTALISANIFTIITNRSWTESLFSILKTPNPTVKWVVMGAALFILLILESPFFQTMFRFEHIGFFEIVISALAGASSIIWFECYKAVKRVKQ